MATDAERYTLYRLKQLHNLKWKNIHPLFPHIPKASQRRIASEYNLETRGQDHENKGYRLVHEQTKNGITVISTSTRIKTLDDLVESAEIDLERWQIERWTANTWEQGQKGPDNSVVLVPLHQVKAFLKANPDRIAYLNIEDLREELQQAAPSYSLPKYKPCQEEPAPVMLELSIPDLHFGKHAWSEETGQSYNMDIADRLYRTAAKALLDAAYCPGIEKIILPTGNDLFHIDTPAGTTTAGTKMDVEGRLRQHFRRVRFMVRETVEQLATIAPVDIIIVPGNHDMYASYYLGEALEDWFHKTPEVNVLNGPKLRKYYRYGKNLIGFTHGDKEKTDRLPMIMANEEAEMWAETDYHEWHLGHNHRKQDIKFQPIKEVDGVRIRSIPSLSATDEWHYTKGFVGNLRSAEAYLWHPENGLIAQYYAYLQ